MSSMMLGVTPISASPLECLSEACSSTRAQFHESLAQVGSNRDAASSMIDSALAPPVSEVQREAPQVSPLGDRILRNLAAMHRGIAFPSVPSAVGGEPTPANSFQLGPAAQPILRSHEFEVHPVENLEGADHFESTLANLRDVYNSVTLVSLISKCTGAASSSLNKLLSAG
ncbi:nodulation protein NolB [Bradyrhizobium sp. SSUT18]|uniref:nodulation protein NolB n=1 Tax=Bradyrhizobium sp. SSUT18 TaxID=3040602 RepID=UPI00244A25E8|nr:nodulation protein NolB [Bradyrhizobium sp. SSUT18]MDH2405183.1 nodulation protein NolB [Bradyrhizobium sp. SSUT18]